MAAAPRESAGRTPGGAVKGMRVTNVLKEVEMKEITLMAAALVLVAA